MTGDEFVGISFSKYLLREDVGISLIKNFGKLGNIFKKRMNNIFLIEKKVSEEIFSNSEIGKKIMILRVNDTIKMGMKEIWKFSRFFL